MSKWVTFYSGILCGDIDFMVHKDRKSAEDYYKNHVTDYMRIRKNQKISLPMCIGTWRGSFIGISVIKFKKDYGSEYEIVNDEVKRRADNEPHKWQDKQE